VTSAAVLLLTVLLEVPEPTTGTTGSRMRYSRSSCRSLTSWLCWCCCWCAQPAAVELVPQQPRVLPAVVSAPCCDAVSSCSTHCSCCSSSDRRRTPDVRLRTAAGACPALSCNRRPLGLMWPLLLPGCNTGPVPACAAPSELTPGSAGTVGRLMSERGCKPPWLLLPCMSLLLPLLLLLLLLWVPPVAWRPAAVLVPLWSCVPTGVLLLPGCSVAALCDTSCGWYPAAAAAARSACR